MARISKVLRRGSGVNIQVVNVLRRKVEGEDQNRVSQRKGEKIGNSLIQPGKSREKENK